MTPLTAAQRTVLLSIKDGTTPPFKGGALANITRKVTEAGYRDENGELTDKGYEALGITPKVRKAIADARAMDTEFEELRKKPEAEQVKVINEILSTNETEKHTKLKHGQKRFEEVEPGILKKAPNAPQKPAGAALVFSESGVELGYYVPYKSEFGTFYRVYVRTHSEVVQITENGTDTEAAARRIVAEYNKRTGNREKRARTTGQQSPGTGTTS